jgi:DNA polymerase I-like protein with 3'-5' exonuclease and polymerase domains
VGCDAEGLELRALAHYMALYDGGAFGESVVRGNKADGTDPHSVNKRLVGLNSRDSAKTWVYAYLYGAGDYKLGTVILEDMTEERKARFHAKFTTKVAKQRALIRLGRASREAVEKGLPALGTLQEKVQARAASGQLRGIDGRILPVRHQHAALNTLLQSAGAIVMKKALVLLDGSLQSAGLVPGVDYEFVANVHDEWQIEAKEGRDGEVARLAAASIYDAGVAYGFRCALAGDARAGRTWADTH